MMSPNPKMGEELKLQQRWDFRRRDNDSDSSSYDSKSSSIYVKSLKKHKLVSSSVSVDNDETNDASRCQQRGNSSPGISDQAKFGKGKKVKRGRSKNDNLAHNQMKKPTQKEVPRKKKKTGAYEHAALDDLKNYMNSLLDDLKVSRENLLKWMREQMQRLVSEETASEAEKREGGFGGEKVQLQHQNHSEGNQRVQCQNNFGKNMQVQHQHNFVEFGQVQHQSKFEENVHVERLVNFEEKIEVHHQKNFQENIQLQHRNVFGSCMSAPNCNGGPTERFGKSNKSADYNNCSLAFEDQVDHSQAIVPVTPTEKDIEERLPLSAKLNPKPSPSGQNVKVQQQKSIVLGIRAQNCYGGSSERSAKGKKTTDSSNHHHVHKDQVDYAQAVGSLTSGEKGKGESLGLSVEPIFASDSYDQVASSMYLTLPSVLTEPYVANHRFDISSFNSIQPRIAGNQTGLNSERSKLILGSSSHCGYFPGMQTEERNRNFSQMSSRDISFLSQNPAASIIGSGFPVPFYQPVNSSLSNPSQVGLENLTQENNNTVGLSINGGARRLFGGSYSSPEQYIANNFLSRSNYKADGRLLAYQEGGQFPKSFMGAE